MFRRYTLLAGCRGNAGKDLVEVLFPPNKTKGVEALKLIRREPLCVLMALGNSKLFWKPATDLKTVQ